MKTEENAPVLNEQAVRQTLTLIAQECNSKQFRLGIPSREADQLTNFSNKPNWTSQNHATILKTFNDALVKSDDQTKQRLLRLIPTNLMSRVLS
jgi:hypothetical protein